MIAGNYGRRANYGRNYGRGVARRRLPFFGGCVHSVHSVHSYRDITYVCAPAPSHTHAHMNPSAQYYGHYGRCGRGIDFIGFSRGQLWTRTLDALPSMDAAIEKNRLTDVTIYQYQCSNAAKAPIISQPLIAAIFKTLRVSEAVFLYSSLSGVGLSNTTINTAIKKASILIFSRFPCGTQCSLLHLKNTFRLTISSGHSDSFPRVWQRVPLGVVAFAGALRRDVSADAGFLK